MNSLLLTIQLIISVLLTIVVLMQNKGEGLSGALGGAGGGEFFATRRGAEKILYRATILLSILFGVNALIFAFLPSIQVFFA